MPSHRRDNPAAEATADVARLAVALIESSDSGLSADVVSAAAAAAALMVTENLADQPSDPSTAAAVDVAVLARADADRAIACASGSTTPVTS